jgi:hypothetical protein
MEPSQGYFADRKIQLVTALKLPNHTAMRLPMVPRISPVCFPSEIERIAHNWYQPEYEIDSNVGDHLQKNERRNPQSKDAIADGKLRVREMNGSKPNMQRFTGPFEKMG